MHFVPYVWYMIYEYKNPITFEFISKMHHMQPLARALHPHHRPSLQQRQSYFDYLGEELLEQPSSLLQVEMELLLSSLGLAQQSIWLILHRKPLRFLEPGSLLPTH